jgi:hypothetical protein
VKALQDQQAQIEELKTLVNSNIKSELSKPASRYPNPPTTTHQRNKLTHHAISDHHTGRMGLTATRGSTMSKYSMEIRIDTLDAMTMALQLTLSHVLDELSKADPKVAAAVKKGFDKAADAAELLAIKEPQSERGKSSLSVLQIVEEFRSITLGNHDNPPGGV